ncbi:MAG: class I SAM-dependent methyltransferase [Okeania sp. SIO2F4]|uniref:class I SAM-dependent methyltransferase n=1 Tax=Okeania sp. SIO2F4 TaxID=2607790 RepID=UPI00142C57DA|nr:class I SAM-dependent methyltransferase [Okeania sp. SIO2F4]NES05139.1 class I SAM-dependent methyltransferase [Okeania sp. SIO2F4]
MLEEELRRINKDFYSRRIDKIEQTIDLEESLSKEVGWGCYENQYQGFQLATNLVNIDWSSTNISILDIGCGYGALARYLREKKGFQGKYTGIDILTTFSEKASELQGNDNRNYFISGDALSYNWKDSKYDFVVSLGTLSVNYDYPEPYGKESLEFAFKLVNLICQLSCRYACLYYPNEKNSPLIQRMTSTDMAFYDPDNIEKMFKEATSGNYKKLITKSYPTADNVKTITSIYF